MAELWSALTMYRQKFGHSVPSWEIKTATLMGEREELRARIVSALKNEVAVEAWAKSDPFAHELAQGGLPEEG